MMQGKKILVIFLFLISFSSFAASSQDNVSTVHVTDPEPMVMMKDLTNKMLRELDKNIGHLKNNDGLIDSLVNRIVVPCFDLVTMSKAVVGRNYWQEASSEVQRNFIKEFTRHVIRTYSSALKSYDGERMKFYPIRGEAGDRVRISSDLLLKNGPPIQLQYGLIKAEKRWLIYDFSVDGVSIIKNYNSQFAGILRQKGLSGLVEQLKKRNLNK